MGGIQTSRTKLRTNAPIEIAGALRFISPLQVELLNHVVFNALRLPLSLRSKSESDQCANRRRRRAELGKEIAVLGIKGAVAGP